MPSNPRVDKRIGAPPTGKGTLKPNVHAPKFASETGSSVSNKVGTNSGGGGKGRG